MPALFGQSGTLQVILISAAITGLTLFVFALSALGMRTRPPFIPGMSSNALLLLIPFAVFSVVAPASLPVRVALRVIAPLVVLLFIIALQIALAFWARMETQEAICKLFAEPDVEWKVPRRLVNEVVYRLVETDNLLSDADRDRARELAVGLINAAGGRQCEADDLRMANGNRVRLARAYRALGFLTIAAYLYTVLIAMPEFVAHRDSHAMAGAAAVGHSGDSVNAGGGSPEPVKATP
jgi:hypothetical protein